MLGRTLPFLLLLFRTCTGSAEDVHQCPPSFCGNISIRNPFRLKADQSNCGYPEYELSCESNRTVLYLEEGKYYVQSINYDNYTIRIVDAGLQQGNCSSMPHSSFRCDYYDVADSCIYYSSYHSSFRCDYHYVAYSCIDYSSYDDDGRHKLLSRAVAYVDCANEINSPFYTKISPCIKSPNSSLGFSRVNGRPYIAYVHNASSIEAFCRIRLVTRTSWPRSNSSDHLSYEEFHEELVYGFELSWTRFLCTRCHTNHYCRVVQENRKYGSICNTYWGPFVSAVEWIEDLTTSLHCTVGSLVDSEMDSQYFYSCYLFIPLWFMLTRGVGLLCVAIFLTYKWRRRHRAVDENIEEFLHNQKNLFPIRYSYSNIKKITKNFKDRLGEGGYGFVYKGKLRSGQDVAIKILKNTKANGQDFINEIATIGRIHHVNVVQLIGFCVEGSKCALVYDFMPNGSLDKHIFYGETGTSLVCKEIYEISLGVARGIEYLHEGCNMQILHFDIKPHNILLDKNFIPKISDFGLAKLYPTSYNNVSLTAARGTLGYMAPELVYKTIGRVSYKADVYSFGKLLMEMAGRRKNVNATVEHSSQIYFPSWVYDQLIEGKNIEIVDAMEEEERKTVEKMMRVALWCIQMNPDDRPPMHTVLKMLEGSGNTPMPCKPVLYPSEVSVQIPNIDTNFELLESSVVSSSLSCTGFFDRDGDIIEEVSLL